MYGSCLKVTEVTIITITYCVNICWLGTSNHNQNDVPVPHDHLYAVDWALAEQIMHFIHREPGDDDAVYFENLVPEAQTSQCRGRPLGDKTHKDSLVHRPDSQPNFASSVFAQGEL